MEAGRHPEGREAGPERAPEGDSRRDRARRGGRQARLYGWVIAGLVLVGLLIAWVAANRDTVQVEWLVGSTDAALALVIFVAAALGWVLGVVTSVAIRRRARRRDRA